MSARVIFDSNIVGGKGIMISGGSTMPYIGFGQSSGNMRFNSNSQRLEIYDGCAWHSPSNSSITIEFTPEIQSALEWVCRQQEKEKRIQELAKKNASVEFALKDLQQAEDRLQIVTILADSKIGQTND